MRGGKSIRIDAKDNWDIVASKNVDVFSDMFRTQSFQRPYRYRLDT